MIVSHIGLKNWRNFRSVQASMDKRVFLVGPNACGKSNFLDAFRFLRDIARPGGGLQKAVYDRGGVSKIRCLAARKEPEIEIEVHITNDTKDKPPWRYSVGIKQYPRGSRLPYLVHEKVYKGDEKILERPDAEDKKDDLRLTQTHLEQINANAEFREIARFMESISYQHLVPQLLRHPEAFTGPGVPDDPFGQSFLERVAKTTRKTRESRLKKIESALQRAVPQLKNLSMAKDEAGVPHLAALYAHWRPQGARQQEDQFSDGTLRLIGLLWSLLEGESLLLLEEPELSLNTAIVRMLPVIIYRLQKKKNLRRQVIISTHSPELLSDSGIGGEEILLLTPRLEGTDVQPASAIKEVRELLEEGFTAAEAIIPRTEPPQLKKQLEFGFLGNG